MTIYNVPTGFELNPIGTADELAALRRWKSTHSPRLEALQGLKDRAQLDAYLGAEARTSLASEREANAILTAELEALRKDAERYRWLRSRIPGSTYRIMGVIYSEGGAGVDAAIDAAMAAQKEPT